MLIDEYDAPVEKAWQNRGKDPEYYENMVMLMRDMLSFGLKGNNDRSYAVLTGIQRVAKATTGSGLNNLTVNSVLSTNYDEFFGFTHEETAGHGNCLWDAGSVSGNLCMVPGIPVWRGTGIHPWSVLSFVAEDGKAKIHWGRVSANHDFEIMERVSFFGTRRDSNTRIFLKKRKSSSG